MEIFIAIQDPIIKLFIGFAIIIPYINYANRNPLAQVTTVDMVSNIILGTIVGGTIYSKNIEIWRYTLNVMIGVSVIEMVNVISRSIEMLRKPILGKPIKLIKDGEFLVKNFKEKFNKMDIVDFMTLLRESGVYSLREVRFSQLEQNGKITTIKYGQKNISYLVIKDGKILQEGLENIGKDVSWLLNKLDRFGNITLDEIFVAEWSEAGLFIVKNNGKNAILNEALSQVQ